MFDNHHANTNFEFYGPIGVFLAIAFHHIPVTKLAAFQSLYNVIVGML